MNEYDNRGQAQLWSNKEGVQKNEKAPRWKGTFVAHRDIKEGEEVDIAMWANDSDNPRAPVMKGKISDRQDRQSENDDGGPIPF